MTQVVSIEPIPELFAALSRFRYSTSRDRIETKGNAMRLTLPLLAALAIAVTSLPAEAARPVKGAVQGTATAATGVAKGTVQAGRGVVRGGATAVRGTARGLRCFVTLGNRC
jgi:hypothetical protein